MTLKELGMIVARQWKLVVGVTLVCVVACGGYFTVAKHETTSSYTATAYIVANSQVSGVAGFASDEGRKFVEASESAGVEIKAEADTTTLTVTVAATGVEPDMCIEAANLVAEAANKAAEAAYSDWESPYAGSVTLAAKAEAESSKDIIKYLFVALLAGLFVSVCIAVMLDIKRRSVKTPEGVQEVVELPVLEILPAKNGERLLANVRFAASGTKGEGGKCISSVLIMPSGDNAAATSACELLQAAAADEGSTLSVQVAQSFSEGMAGAYAAQDVDAVVVTARQWADTLPQLESTVAELRLAGANLAGIAFAKEKLD